MWMTLDKLVNQHENNVASLIYVFFNGDGEKYLNHRS